MTSKARRAVAILGCVLAGLSLGAGIDGLLASADRYLTFAFSNGFSPFGGGNIDGATPSVPGLASAIFPLAGAAIGLGLGMLVAALIPNDPN